MNSMNSKQDQPVVATQEQLMSIRDLKAHNMMFTDDTEEMWGAVIETASVFKAEYDTDPGAMMGIVALCKDADPEGEWVTGSPPDYLLRAVIMAMASGYVRGAIVATDIKNSTAVELLSPVSPKLIVPGE